MGKQLSVDEFLGVSVTRKRDLYALGAVLEDSTELRDYERDAMADMKETLESWSPEGSFDGEKVGYEQLTEKQRRWVHELCKREGIDPTPPEERRPVPRGREVPLAKVLQALPLKPPGRR